MSKSSAPSNPATFDEKETISYGLPVRLKIPSINVDTQIDPVGLTVDGLMGVPKNPDNVAWYEAGPRPGDIGSAVVDGHYGVWKNGQATVFNDLDKLEKGDKLSIEDDKGTTVSFIVRKTQIYDSKADATAIFSSSDGLAHLNLITCEGVWNQVSKSFPRRLVIFTAKIS